jgi:hypothetical protein
LPALPLAHDPRITAAVLADPGPISLQPTDSRQ